MTRQQAEHKSEPLRAWRQFHSRDIDEARSLVAQKFCDHRLQPAGRSLGFGTRHNHVPGRSLSLNYLCYGSAVQIDPGELQDFYLVQMPLSGAAVVANGAAAVGSNIRQATVLNPTRATQMTWQADCRMLLLQIDRNALHGIAERASGLPLSEPVVFDTAAPISTGPLHDWARQFIACVRATDAQVGFGHWGALQQQVIEEQLILGLLTHQQSNIRHLLSPRAPLGSSLQIRRAQDYIHANAAEPLTVSAIAAEAGCSIRTLQTGFRQHFGLTPVEYLRDLRLDLARYLLLSRPAGTPVSSIAYDSGFSHLGRFSQLYRARFGELPSTTRAANGFPDQTEQSTFP
ncbi:AraC-like ligand-binding domain-containing protein [Leisingera aquaemixtae]|uniref:L-rhamnose operon regulatory protein RhaS n=1 Tax=Leisingera aquaemixtae TaxID=1396826 RepID=A0A0P1HCS8_9RHOB|nr:AraC family transcriptional regulator [Leisingera aquaemixtae]CUI01454.1 L-rhamnose operon regulatory protein RhaS [Leisingera aquaemixtae]